MKVNFTGVKGSAKRIGCGVQDVVITGASFGQEKNEKQTPFLLVDFSNKELGTTHSEKFHLTQPALPKLRHLMVEGLGFTEAQINRDNTEDQLIEMLKGKTVRLKFTGEEYIRKNDGGIGMSVGLPFDNYAEKISVSKDRTGLIFSAERDIKKVVQAPTEEELF